MWSQATCRCGAQKARLRPLSSLGRRSARPLRLIPAIIKRTPSSWAARMRRICLETVTVLSSVRAAAAARRRRGCSELSIKVAWSFMPYTGVHNANEAGMLQYPLMNFGIVVYRGSVYVMGGQYGGDSLSASASIQVSSDAGSTWLPAPGISATAPWSARYNHALCVVGADKVRIV